ncbi:MAG: hypothetical protein KJJ56_01845 [Serratia rubidaea]|nr:hypothetical protein [Serratia rubidaea]
MAWLGFINARACRHWQDASPFLPAFSFYERHQSAPIDAAPQAIIHAVQALDMQEDPLIRRLLALRQLPDRLRRRAKPPRPFGFDSFTPLHQDSHELSLGLAGRFWRPTLVLPRPEDARQFLLFADPDAAKLVLRFKVVADQIGQTRLRTETFVYCPTPQVKARFACYWLLIRPASGWIRRRTLSAVRRKLAATASSFQP